MFDLLDIDGDGVINLYDLLQLTGNFAVETEVGKLANYLLECYKL